MAEANLLKCQIEEAFRQFPEPRIESWRPSNGWEVTGLWVNADLWVTVQGKGTREFVVITIDGLASLCTEPDWQGFYTCGGPLIVVDKISGETIARGISKYLDIELGRA